MTDILVRDMQESDILALADAFDAQGWASKHTKQFTNYMDEHRHQDRHVLVAEYRGNVAGYVTLLPKAHVGPFPKTPLVCDFNVLKEYQRKGVGTELMDAVENIARKTSDTICLSVGMYADYGAAQRMYVKRGYVPDGTGVWYKDKNLPPYHECCNDDDLVLYMSKSLRLSTAVREIFAPAEKSEICNTILRALPNWFGVEESIIDYVAGVASKPFYCAFDNDTPVGFVSILPHNAFAVEIYVMGILESHQRAGIGRKLVRICENYCRITSTDYLTVKTLAETHPDLYYARTRRFYNAMGFRPLEVFTQLWGEENPCLFLIKNISLYL